MYMLLIVKKHFTVMNNPLLRQAFSNQNGQCLIIDVSDINVTFLDNVIKAAQDILALACSVRGGVRIPAFSLSVLTKGITKLYEFDAIRGNFSQILHALNSVSAYCQINEGFEPQDYKDSLYQVIDSVIRTHSEKQYKSDWIKNIAQIEITFVTMRDCQILKSYIQTFIEEMEVSKIFKIVIIELQHIEHEIIENKNGLIHTIIMNGENNIQIQRHFKSWLLDQSTEIGAILHLPGSEPHLSLKCDVVECIINPLSLPFGHRVYLQLDCLSVQMTGMSVTKTFTSNVPIYEINILARVSTDAICESTLFGLPLCLRPTKSWRLTIEQEEANQEYFSELCKQLSECEQFLFAQMKSHIQTDQFSPYFVLTPGDCCLLMKSFASSDLTLPWKQENLNKEASMENSLKVMSSLQNIQLLNNLDPNMYECGLFTTLKANLKHAKRDSTFDIDEPTTSKRYKRNK